MVLYCSGIMHKYYYCIVFSPIKQDKEEKTHNEIFNNIPNLIKNRLNVDFIQDGFVIFKNKVIIRKI